MFARALLSLLLAEDIGISGVLHSAKETKVKNRRIDEKLINVMVNDFLLVTPTITAAEGMLLVQLTLANSLLAQSN